MTRGPVDSDMDRVGLRDRGTEDPGSWMELYDESETEEEKVYVTRLLQWPYDVPLSRVDPRILYPRPPSRFGGWVRGRKWTQGDRHGRCA